MALCISVHQTNYSRATTLPRYGTGPSMKSVCFSAGSLIIYKGSWCPESGTRHPRIRVDAYWWSIHYNDISQAARRHLGSPAVAPELHSEGGTAGACQGGRLHREGTWMEGFDRLSEPHILMYDGPWWYPGGFIGWCG
jgi:hypothetical protein